MNNTDIIVDGKKVTYEILEDGYKIYLEGRPWIHQYEPFIPHPANSYEESCIKHLEEIREAQKKTGSENNIPQEEQIAAIQEKVNMLTEAIMEMSADVYGE